MRNRKMGSTSFLKEDVFRQQKPPRMFNFDCSSRELIMIPSCLGRIFSESCEVVWFALILCVWCRHWECVCDTWSGYCDDMCSPLIMGKYETSYRPINIDHWNLLCWRLLVRRGLKISPDVRNGVVAWLLEALYVHYHLVTTLEIRPTHAAFLLSLRIMNWELTMNLVLL